MAKRRIEIKAWRILATDGGLFMFFDPSRERPRLYHLEPGEETGGTLVVREDALEMDESARNQLTLFDRRENPHGSS